ncbi:MAG: LarC family nickel insertion protein [Verrucomicrobia bacterium]|nr:LarC family nickel insertion protein [Verrucomicrobiota bacterium]
MEVQLDPVGGIAGDMFLAALLHAFPEHQDGMFAAITALRLPGLDGCHVETQQNGNLQGLRFVVDLAMPADHAHEPDSFGAEPANDQPPAGMPRAGGVDPSARVHVHPEPTDGASGEGNAEPGPHPHPHHHPSRAHRSPAHRSHAHTTWLEIRELIRQSPLSAEVKRHALGIFTLLARAEASVHGISEERVAFHEVGATDSIVDIVGAAYLIDALQPSRWIVGSLPLGAGRVRTAHGWLPVPAPATAALLEGFQVHRDGIDGERVTPTGAAIVRYLAGCSGPGQLSPWLWRTGTGLGARSLPGISNCLRVLAFSDHPLSLNDPQPAREPAARVMPDETSPELNPRQLAVVEFEVDDQTPEDLATALDHLRSDPAVLDVVQQTAIGKRGRAAAHIRLLTAPREVERVACRCFQETATIGLRYHFVQGFTLTRTVEPVRVAGRAIRVKVVARPDAGFSGKPEMEDLARIEGGYVGRTRNGQLAVDQALSQARARQGSPEEKRAGQGPARTEPFHDDDDV